MKILSIGNSFSQDAQRYLHRIAKKDGLELTTANLCIGGCSLRTHYLNMLNENVAYDFEFNGETTFIKVSLKQALEGTEWDVITLQQASAFSADAETYLPYIEELVQYIKKYAPRSKIFVHETWAYEDGCERLKSIVNYNSAQEMFEDIRSAYAAAAKAIKADGLIPCGTVMLKALSLGIKKIHRDTFHASLGTGRYLLGLTWYKVLTGKDVSKNDFNEFDEPVTEEERAIVINAVNAIVQ